MIRLIGLASAGLIGSLAFAPLQWWPAMLVSVTMFIALIQGGSRIALLHGGIFGLGFFLPMLHWSGTYVGAFPWIALATLQSGFFAAMAVAIAAVKRHFPRSTLLVALVPTIWVAQEALRSRFPWGGFGWGRVAFSQVDAPHVGVVALGGAPLLTWLTIALATALAIRRWRPLVSVVLMVTALAAISAASLPALTGNLLRVAVVQGNVPRLGLDFNAQRQAVLNNHIAATEQLTPASVDLILWPENASDIDPLDDATVRARLDRLAQQQQAPLIVGAVLREDGALLNASLLWTPSEGASERYIKRRLAPFGEFMPLRSIAEAVVPAASRVVDFTPGTTTTLFEVAGERVGSLICFEVLYDDLSRDLVRAGATLLVAQTNSATFGTSPESRQQLQMTRLRAIEHHRAIASASTSGISAIIDHRGRVLAESDFFTQDILTGKLATVRGTTLSARLGSWPELLLISLPLMLLPILIRRRRR